MMNQFRLQKLQQEISSQGLDGIALMPGPNMLYISGIHTHLSERPIILFIPAQGDPGIIIPTLEAMKAEAAGIPEERIFAWNDVGGYLGAFEQAAAALNLNSWQIGVEALHMRVLELETLQQVAPGIKSSHAERVMNNLRMEKDNSEIAAMEKAIHVAENGMHALLPQIKLGMTEKQVAALLIKELLAAGGGSIAFGPIVASGPNSASPHATPTDRALAAGDLLVIDWGVFVDDYPSDITRTFAVGEIEPEFHEIYNAVKAANESGRAAVKPGVTGEEVDWAARLVIENAGYGEFFFHRTGHGLGLEIHEEPNMVKGNTKALNPGNVFTVEPGIYLQGRGGVRIEDNVVVTAAGHRTMTSFPRDLIVVGVDK